MTLSAVPPSPVTRVTAPRHRRWTKAEYYKMWELGWFEGERVELLDGQVVQLPNPGPAHCVSADNVAEGLKAVFPRDRFWVRMQGALDLGLDVELRPDVAVADGPKASFGGHFPTTALLVVEVSDATLSFDRGRKASIYARADIADYWVVNVNERQLEIRRRPVPDPAAPAGYRYDDVTTLGEADSASPLAAPQAAIRVAYLLP
jgi:Uma2 family endonuclease